MRLAFVSIEDPENVRTWSGIPYFVLQELRRKGVDVTVISPLRREFKYLFFPSKLFAQLNGTSLQINRHPLMLESFARQIARRVEGMHYDAIFSMSSVPVSRLNVDIPILTWTDAVVEGMINYYGDDFAKLSAAELHISHEQEQSALDRSAFAIYSSDWAAGIVRNHYLTSTDKVQIIEFGANLSVDHDEQDITKLCNDRIASESSLLFIGVDWERKGGALAFEATRLLNQRGLNTTLRVVGCDAPEAPFVEQFGYVNKHSQGGRQKINDLFRTSTFFLLPTRAEAAGIVFCEAAAFGLPVVTTRTGGVENYVKDSVTGYCLPLSATGSEYADCIERIILDKEKYRRLSHEAFRRYKQTLNWGVGVSSLLNLVERASLAQRV